MAEHGAYDYLQLDEPWDVRELYIRKTADLSLQLLVGTFPCFVAIRFYFLSETLIVAVIIQLVSRYHVCRFENGSQMAE
jgi:hypothetical protein